MIIDETLVLGVLVGLAVLVVGLLVVVLFMAKSLRKKPPVVAKVKSSKPKELEVATKGLNASAEADAEVDVTRMTAFAPQHHLPRLSVEEDRDETSDEMSISESKAILQFETESWVDIEEPTGPHDLILMSAMGQTDRGVTRRRNEDAYLIDTNLQLYAVADGMGGYAGGDIASRLAVQEIRTAIQAPDANLKGHEDRPRRGRELIAAVERANQIIYKEAQSTRDLHGMGTTIIAARFSPQKQRMYLAHVGDSRCYRLRKGELVMMTKDHTLASRGVVGPLASNICRAVGVAKTVKVDLIVDKPLPDDIYLLCSDGLPKMVKDDQIREILSQDGTYLDRTAAALVLAANANGGRDNITVLVVGILEISKRLKLSAAAGGKNAKRVEFGPS